MPQLKLYSLRYPLFIFSFLVSGCEQKSNTDIKLVDVTPDSVVTENTQKASSEENIYAERHELVRFLGTADDDVRTTLRSLPAFDHVYAVVEKYVVIQDSLESALQLWGQSLTDPKDTALVFPYKEKAYQAIIDYKKQMALAPSVAQNNFPTLLNLTRVPEPDDSSKYILPDAKPSNLLSAGNFFFLGGFPFLSKLSPRDDSNIFTDQQGKPETRFGLSLQENTSYLLNSVTHAKPTAIDITYGPPLYTYEMGNVEVYGIGSLIHNFVGRIPAFFITESGLVPAQLLSAQRKLGGDYSCGEGEVYVEFACSKSLDEQKIHAIYIPYGPSPTSSTFNRLSDNLWTADLNSDGTVDFACVTNNYLGDMGYEIAEALWYANINGEWKIIDWAEMPECT